MLATPVNLLIDRMVEQGKLGPEHISLRGIGTRYREVLDGIRHKILEAAHSLGVEPSDSYLRDCLYCIAYRHDFRGYRQFALSANGVEKTARCTRCGTIRNSLRVGLGVRHSYPSFHESSDRQRYLTVRELIGPQEAVMIFDALDFYTELEAMAAKMGIEIPVPLVVF